MHGLRHASLHRGLKQGVKIFVEDLHNYHRRGMHQCRVQTSSMCSTQGEEKGGAFVRHRLRPHQTVVSFNQFAHNGQTRSGAAAVLLAAMQSLDILNTWSKWRGEIPMPLSRTKYTVCSPVPSGKLPRSADC